MNEENRNETISFLMKHFWWIDPYLRKYGNPDVEINAPKNIGKFTDEDITEAFSYRHFFIDTPYLWDNKRVLDLGCGGPRTRETLKSLYPSVDYVGLDILAGEGVDIVADARKKLSFKVGEFDTITAFGFMPERFWGLFNGRFSGNIRHYRRPLKEDGHFVASCVQSFFSEKPGWYKTIRKSFRILEERTYKFSYQRSDSDFAMPMEQTFVIGRKKIK